MTTPPTPEIPAAFTRATLDRAAAAPGVATAPPAGGMAGINIEQIVSFGERIVRLVDQFQKSLAQIRGIETQRSFNGDSGTVYDPVAGDPIYMDNPNPLPGPAPPITPPVPVAAQTIEAINVYRVLLGAMNKLVAVQPDIKVSEALELARTHKETVLPQIEAEIVNMTGGPREL